MTNIAHQSHASHADTHEISDQNGLEVTAKTPKGSTAVTRDASEVTKQAPNGGSVVTQCCSVPGCIRPHKAKGLCFLHYRRQRRTNDPENAHGSGKDPDKLRTIVDATFPEWSDRTRARFVRAWKLANFAGRDFGQLILAVTRADGSIRVSELLERAEDAAAWHIVMMEPTTSVEDGRPGAAA